MIFTEETISRRLNIIVQNDFDWLQLFDDQKQRNEMPIVLNEGNMDFFYPNWRTKYDPENLPETLDDLVADRFKTIRVTTSDSISFRGGDGEYEVESFAITFPVDDVQDRIDIPLGSTPIAIIFYKVTPLPKTLHDITRF